MRITFVVALCLTTLIPQVSSIQINVNDRNQSNDGNADELTLAGTDNKNESDGWWNSVLEGFEDMFGGGEDDTKKEKAAT